MIRAATLTLICLAKIRGWMSEGILVGLSGVRMVAWNIFCVFAFDGKVFVV